MDEQRRRLVEAGTALGAMALLGEGAVARGATDADADVDRVVPQRPATPTPGRPGDFDFLAGEWQIQHRRRPGGSSEWDRFRGEATCWSLLAGAASVEELRIPERGFSGMGLRLLDVSSHVWSDYWVNARSGVLGAPGMPGSFERGAGLFFSEDSDDRGPFVVASVWDRITPAGCRWRQLVSRDQGRSWEPDWIMEWTRR
jgi:hypothetical protein